MNNTFQSESRFNKTMLNVVTGGVLQFLTLFLNFVVRIVFVRVIGYSYLGISALFANILTVLSVADLGFGTSISISLYSALRKGDENHIAGIISYYKKIYLIIAGIIFGVGCLICPFIGLIVNTETPIKFLSVYFFIYLVNLISTYLISYRHAIIKADQKNGIINIIHSLVLVCKSVVELLIILILPKLFDAQVAYLVYLVVMVLATYGNEIWCAAIAKKMYPYAFKKTEINTEEKKEITTNVKNLLLYKVCKVVNTSVDSILISILVSTTILGKYSNYTLIIGVLMGFGCLVSRNAIASLGNFVLTESKEKQVDLFYRISFIHILIAAFFVINYIGILEPFFALSFGAGSTLSVVVLFFTAVHIAFDLNYQVNELFRETTKLFRKIPYISLINLGLNIVFSIVFGIFFGLEGIIGGTLLAYFLTSFWFESYALFKYHFQTSSKTRWIKLGYAILSISFFAILCYFINSKIVIDNLIIKLVVSALISLTLSVCCLFSFAWFKQFKGVFNKTKDIITIVLGKVIDIVKKPLFQKITLLTSIVVLASLVAIRDIFGIEINKFIFVALCSLSGLLLIKNYYISYLFFVIPFHSGLPSKYIYVIFLGLFVLKNLTLFKNWKKAINYFLIPTVILIAEILLSTLYGEMSPINEVLSLFAVLSIFSFIIYDRKIKAVELIRFFTLGASCVVLIILIRWVAIAHYMSSNTSVTSMTFIKILTQHRFGDLNEYIAWNEVWCELTYPHKTSMYLTDNPNYLGLVMLVSVMCAAYQLFQKDKLLVKIGLGLCLVLCLFCGVYTGSKSFFFCFAFFLLYFIAMLYGVNKLKALPTLLIFAILGLSVTLVCIYVPFVNENIVQRIHDDSGRFRLIADYGAFIFSKPLIAIFGCGVSRLQVLSGFAEPPHNAIIQILGGYGLLGFGIIIFGLVLTIRKGRPKLLLFEGDMLLAVCPLFVYFVFTMTSQIFMPVNTLVYGLPIFYIYVCRNNFINEKNALKLDAVSVIGNNNLHEEKEMKSLKTFIKKVYRKLDYYLTYFLNDKKYIKHQFKQKFGYKPDLKHPKTLCEKLQWLKLNDRKNVYTDMVDKKRAKDFAMSKGLKVIPTLGYYKRFKDIDFDKLPDQFIMKTTHSSGGFIICKDKKTFDYEEANYVLTKSLKRDYYKSAREWPYKNVERAIIIEPLIETLGKPDSIEYKITCFNGKVEFITVCRGIAHTKYYLRKNDFYDRDFNFLPFVTEYYENSHIENKKPAFFDKMIEQSEKMAEGTHYLRVDFYDIDGEPVFGEATFFTWAGYMKFIPEEYDRILGDKLVLPCDKVE